MLAAMKMYFYGEIEGLQQLTSDEREIIWNWPLSGYFPSNITRVPATVLQGSVAAITFRIRVGYIYEGRYNGWSRHKWTG